MPLNEQEILDVTGYCFEQADSVYNTLTLEERVGQCFMPALKADTIKDNIRKFRRYVDDFHVGGIVLMQGDMNSAHLLGEMGKSSKIPLFISIDAEWGLGMRLKDAPVFPKNGYINNEAADNLLFDYGSEIARECRSLGINMVLGPVVDLRSKHAGIIGYRSYDADPLRVADLGVSYAKGLEAGGVVSVAKHFPGHGNSMGDSHLKAVENKKNISMLDSMDFMPFRIYINSGLSGIMAGHIKIPAIDREGIPASVSEIVLVDLLRHEMGFKGLVITDAFNMGGVDGFEGWEALKAGADIVLAPNDLEEEIKKTIDKINKGEIDVRLIDDRCRRILFYKSLFKLWDNYGDDDIDRFNEIRINELYRQLN